MPGFRQKNVLLALSRYYYEIHSGVARYAAQHGWHLNCDMAITGLLPAGWKGQGILTLLADREDVARLVRRANVPVVDLAIGRPDIKVPRVTGDNAEIARLAGYHFLERGFRTFAWYANDLGHVADLRRDEYFKTVQSRALVREDWTFRAKRAGRNGEWIQRLNWLSQRLRAVPKPVAVFAYRDTDAVDVLDAALREGFDVPGEVSILGVGNSEIICESVSIPLSSVKHSLTELGFAGAELLDRLMAGARPPAKPRLIAPQGIQVRRSTDSLAVSDPRVLAALRLFRENTRRIINPNDAASVVGVPRKTLESAFVAQLGHSMQTEVAKTRLARAKSLLISTGLPVADVAAMAGFNTPQYFNNVFRQAYGITPRKYRLHLQAASTPREGDHPND